MTNKQSETKKKYEVVKDFYDGQDNKKEYVATKPYPQPANKKIEQERIDFLIKEGYIKEI
ncbi:hypothetical protein ETI08_01025 [Macrococcoides goetzii]|nr:hypothetical protein [Macrococcus goetzii]TDM47746.1 hypothetical protein ETI08_01025 [Macrococcus goetzii]